MPSGSSATILIINSPNIELGMAEGPIHCKTIQQNLVNYISHNLGRKADKEKEMKREKTDCKNSSGKGIKADRTSTNSASHPNRLSRCTRAKCTQHTEFNYQTIAAWTNA